MRSIKSLPRPIELHCGVPVAAVLSAHNAVSGFFVADLASLKGGCIERTIVDFIKMLKTSFDGKIECSHTPVHAVKWL